MCDGDGFTLALDAALMAVGVQPNVKLAEQAKLSIGTNGVLIDSSLSTSDPDIYAVDDTAYAEHLPFAPGSTPSTEPMHSSSPAVAVAIMLGKPGAYAKIP